VNAALHRGNWKTQARQHDRDIRFNRDSGIEIPEAWMPTIKKNTTTGKPHDSRPPEEQITE